MHTPSHTFIAVKFDTTGKVERNPFDVVKKLSIVVTPVQQTNHMPILIHKHTCEITNLKIWKLHNFISGTGTNN